MNLRNFGTAVVCAAVMAFPAFAQDVAYSVDSNVSDSLFEINLASGAATNLGGIGFGDAEGLAWVEDTLYAIGGTEAELWDITSPPGTLVGNTGARNGLDAGLDVDPTTGRLYNFQGNIDGSFLYEINPSTGAASLIGTNSVFGDGLAINCDGMAYTADFIFDDALFSVDLGTGAATRVGPLNIGNVSLQCGLAFANGTLYAITSDSRLWTINTSTGQATQVATVSGSTGFEGFATKQECGPNLRLAFSGNCPGTGTFDVVGATPNGNVALVYGFGDGPTTIPSTFPCAGTVLNVGNPNLDNRVIRADANGNATFSTFIPAAACGAVKVQALDLGTCAVSNVVNP